MVNAYIMCTRCMLKIPSRCSILYTCIFIVIYDNEESVRELGSSCLLLPNRDKRFIKTCKPVFQTITYPVIAGFPDLLCLLSICLCVTWQNVRMFYNCMCGVQGIFFFHTDISWTEWIQADLISYELLKLISVQLLKISFFFIPIFSPHMCIQMSNDYLWS